MLNVLLAIEDEKWERSALKFYRKDFWTPLFVPTIQANWSKDLLIGFWHEIQEKWVKRWELCGEVQYVLSCSRMRHLALFSSYFSLASPIHSFIATEHNIQDRNAPRSKLPLHSRKKHLADQTTICFGSMLRYLFKTLMLSSDPGRPLGPDDFFLASQLSLARTNETAEQMMLPPLRLPRNPARDEDLILEDKELQGAETEAIQGRYPKNGLSKLTWVPVLLLSVLISPVTVKVLWVPMPVESAAVLVPT